MFIFKSLRTTLIILIGIYASGAMAGSATKITLSGVDKRSAITQVPELWLDFEKANYLHSTLKSSPQKVYVVYDAFAKDYLQADVLIGYDVRDLKRYKHSEAINVDKFTQVLAKGIYSSKQLTDAWQAFDYRKQVKAVLEIHTLASLGNKEQVALYVQYQ